MKSKSLLFIFTIISSSLFGQITVIGDVKYSNGKKFRYRKPVKVEIKSDNTRDTAHFYYEQLNPVTRSDEKPGTEIYFQMPQQLFDAKKNNFYKKIDINCIFYYPSFDNSQDKSKMSFNVDLSDGIQYNPKTFRLNNPIIILGEPERFTLTMMIMDINDDFRTNEKDSGFQRTVRKLESHMDDYYNSKKVDYNTLLEFYRLLEYTDYYVKENSFFSQEATKLLSRINQINKELSDTSNRYQLIEKTELLNELIVSNRVYQEYQKVYGQLKDYNSRLQLILFTKTK